MNQPCRGEPCSQKWKQPVWQVLDLRILYDLFGEELFRLTLINCEYYRFKAMQMSIDRWVYNRMWYIHTTEYYSAFFFCNYFCLFPHYPAARTFGRCQKTKAGKGLSSGWPHTLLGRPLIQLLKREILSYATTWMNLEIILLNEMSESQKDTYYKIPLVWSI